MTLAVRGGSEVPALNGRVAFGDVTFGQTERKTLIVTNKSGALLTLKATGVGGANGFSLQAAGVTGDINLPPVPDDGTLAFTLAFTPPAAGPQSATFTINHIPIGATTPTALRSFTVSARGVALTGAAAIGLTVKEDGNAVVPVRSARVSLGHPGPSDTVSKTIVVTNRSGGPLTLKATGVAGVGGANGFSLQAVGVTGDVSLDHGGTKEFRLSFRHPADSTPVPGDKTATFTIRDSTGATLRTLTAYARLTVPSARKVALGFYNPPPPPTVLTYLYGNNNFGIDVGVPRTKIEANFDSIFSPRSKGNSFTAQFNLFNRGPSGNEPEKSLYFSKGSGSSRVAAGVSRISGSSKFTVSDNLGGRLFGGGSVLGFRIAFNPAGQDVVANTPEASATFKIEHLVGTENRRETLLTFTVRASTTDTPTSPNVRLAYDKAGETVLFDGTGSATAIAAHFGSTPRTADIVRTFTLTNNTGSRLALKTALTGTGDRFSATGLTGGSGGNLNLADGANTTFRVTFDPQGDPAAASARFEIKKADGSTLLAFSVRATATEANVPLVFFNQGTTGDTTEVYAGTGSTATLEAPIGSTPRTANIEKTFRLTNNTGRPLKLKSALGKAEAGTNRFTATAITSAAPTLAHGDHATFTITFDPQGDVTTDASAAFTIQYDDNNTPRTLLSFNVRASSTHPNVALVFFNKGTTGDVTDVYNGAGAPATLEAPIGSTPWTANIEKTFRLTNGTGHRLTLKAALAETEDTENVFSAARLNGDSGDDLALVDGDHATFTITFAPKGVVKTDASAKFTIEYVDDGAKQQLLAFSVEASSTAPDIALVFFNKGTTGDTTEVYGGTGSTATLGATIGSTPKDTPVAKTFRLTNNTGRLLTLKAALDKAEAGANRFSATAIASDSSDTLALATGDHATFTITFDPQGAVTAAASAAFTIQYDDDSTSPATARPLLAFTARAAATALTGAAAIKLEIKGAPAADNTVVPALNGSVSLGDVALFATGGETLVVTNTSGAELALKARDDGANGFSLEATGAPAPVSGRVTLGNGARREFRLAFTPPAASASRFGPKTATLTIKSGTDETLRSFTASARVIAPPVTVAGPANLDAASARESGVAVDLGRIAKTAGKKAYAFKIHNGATATGFRIGQISRESGPSAFTVKAAPPANSDLAAGSGGLDVQIEFDPAARDAFTGARSDAIFNIAVNAATATGDAEAWHYKLSLRLDVTGDAGLPAIRVAGPAEPTLGEAHASAHVFEFTAAAGAAESGETFTIYSTGTAGAWVGEVRKKPDTGEVFKLKTAPGKKVLQADPSAAPDDNDKTTFVLTFDPPAKVGTYEATFEIPVHRVATSTGGGEGTRGDEVSIHVLKLKATVTPVPLVVQPLAGPFEVNEDAGKGGKIGKDDGKGGRIIPVLRATRGVKTVPGTTFTLSGEGASYFTVNAAGEIVRSDVNIVPPRDYNLGITAREGDDTSKLYRVTVTVKDNVRPKVTTTGDIALATGSPGVRLETDTHATRFAFVGDSPAWLKLDEDTGVLSVDAARVTTGDWERGHGVKVRAIDARGDGPPADITAVLGANPAHGLTVVVALLPEPPVPEQKFGFTVSASGGGAPASVFGDPRPFSVRVAAGKAGRVRIPRPTGLKRATLPLRVALDTLPAGFKITKVACDSKVTPKGVDLAQGHFNVGLGVANVTCTVSVSGAGYAARIVRLTEAAIDRLLDRRVDLLVGDSLNLPARFQGSGGSSGSMGPGPVGIGFTATDSRNMSFSLGTSLAQLRGHAHRDAAHRAAVNAGKLGLEVPFQTAREGGMAAPRYDIWGRVRYTTFADKVSSEGKSVDYKGTALIASFGGDVRVTEDVLVGLMGRLDRMEGKLDGPGGDADGTGWMVGPYVAARFGPDRNLFAEAQGLWGQSDNKVDPLGTYRDSFRTSRWQVSGKLSGTFDLGPVRLVPAAGVSWFTESQRAYVDRNGYRIGGRDISIGRLQFGPGIARDFDLGEATLTVTGGIDGIWNFARPKQRHASSLDKTSDTFRGQGKLGVDLSLPSGLAVGLAGRYDGIGAKNRKAWGGEINVRVPLN